MTCADSCHRTDRAEGVEISRGAGEGGGGAGIQQIGRDLRGGPEAVRWAVGGGCQSDFCRLQMPLKLGIGWALEGPPSNASLGGGGGGGRHV